MEVVTGDNESLRVRAFAESRWFILLMGALAAFDPLSIDMYLPAFPSIQRDLHTTYSAVELSLSAFFIGMALGQLVYGPLADRYGRRRPLLAGMTIYMIATIGCALAPNVTWLVVMRVLQAFGGCAGMVITRAIIRDLFDRTRSAQFLSSLMLVFGLAPILAPLAGGYLARLVGWRAIFWLLAVSNFFCMLCIAAYLPETLREKVRGRSLGDFVRMYWQLLKTRSFIGYLIPDATIRAGMFAYIAGSPFVFVELFHVPQQHFGWIFGSNAIGLVSATQLNRRWLKYRDPDEILQRMLPFTAAAAVTLFVLPHFVDSVFAVFVPLFLFLFGFGFIGANSIAGAMASQGHHAGMASALYGTLQWSLASGSSFLVSHLHDGTAGPMTGVICACGLAATAAFWTLVGKSRAS